MAKNCLTVIEVTDNHVKCLQVKIPAIKGVLLGLEVQPLHQHTDDELARVIGELVQPKSVQADQLILSVPRRLTILKRLRLPSSQDHELRKMIGLQLVNQMPYSLDEVMFDYQVVSKNAEGYTDALVVIVTLQVTGRFLQILKKAGLSSPRMTLSSLGLAQWWFRVVRSDKSASQEPVCLVNIDAAHSEIAFCHQQTLLFSRSVNYGERDLTEEGVASMVRQIEMSLRIYQDDKLGEKVRKIILVCRIPEVALLKNRLERTTGLFVRVCAPLDGWEVPKKFQRHVGFGADGWNAAVACGLSLLDPKRGLNLTPPEVHENKQLVRQRREWVFFIMLFLITFSLGAAVFGIELVLKEQHLSSIRERGRLLDPALRDANVKTAFVEAFEKKIADRVMVSRIMEDLYALTPADLSYRSIYLDERNQLTLQGYSESGAGVNMLQQGLLKSSSFADVTLEFATKRRIFNVELTDFKIVARVSTEAGR